MCEFNFLALRKSRLRFFIQACKKMIVTPRRGAIGRHKFRWNSAKHNFKKDFFKDRPTEVDIFRREKTIPGKRGK